MKVAVYARVSTDDHDQNPDRQVLKGRQYAALHNHEVIGDWRDYYTGDSSPFERPEFKKLMATEPEAVIVESMDRLSRQHPVKIMALLSQFKNQGVKVVSVTEPIFNMEHDYAEPMQYFLTWWNNQFLKKLKRDILSGIDRARIQGTKSGKPIGRPEVEFNRFRAYHLLMVEKVSLRGAAMELGVSPATLLRFKREALKNPAKYINKDSV